MPELAGIRRIRSRITERLIAKEKAIAEDIAIDQADKKLLFKSVK